MMLVAGVVTYYIDSVEGAWKFLLSIGAGTGLVYLLRWYWWRVNAWSEVSAMATALVVSLALQLGAGFGTDDPRGFAQLLLATTALTTVVWLAVTWLTPPEPLPRLRAFYARVRPGGPGWRAVEPSAATEGGLGGGLLQWVAGCAVVYLGLFGIGDIVLRRSWRGVASLAVALALTAYLARATASGPTARRREARVV
jgi:hypothetical protein